MDDYEKKLNEERREAGRLMARLDKIIKGAGFEPQPDDERARSTRAYARGKRADGATCAMEANTYGLKDRVSFTAWTPNPEDGTHVKTPSQVTFTITKTDEQIIKGIQSRYLAEFNPCMDEYRTRWNRARNFEAKRQEIIELAGAILGLPVSKAGQGGREYPRLYEYCDDSAVKKVLCETFYQGESVKLELELDRAGLVAVCEALAPLLKKGGK